MCLLVQVECEHQLGIECERTAAAIKQRDAAEARTAALEAQFTEYVATQRNAPEAQLKLELVEAQQAVKAAEAKLQAAVKLKQKYKQQVRLRNADLLSAWYLESRMEEVQGVRAFVSSACYQLAGTHCISGCLLLQCAFTCAFRARIVAAPLTATSMLVCLAAAGPAAGKRGCCSAS